MSERNGEERKSKTAIVFRLRTHHLLCFFLYFRRVFFLLVGVHLVLFIFSCLFHRCWEEEAHERQKKNINLLVVDDRPPKRAPSITVASFRLRDSFVTQLARAGHRISFFYLFFFWGGGSFSSPPLAGALTPQSNAASTVFFLFVVVGR